MRLTSVRCEHFVKELILSMTDGRNKRIDLRNFKKFIMSYDKILALTGAGISTESGLPDYRSADGLFEKTNYKPIEHSKFLKSPEARQRFWARNYIGWPRFSTAVPNETHHFFTQLEFTHKLLGIITQNVDGLHSKAGSSKVIELHGNAYWVRCLNCKSDISRYDFQKTLSDLNPNCDVSVDMVRPDGDVEISHEITENFVVPDCEKCGGILKPTVVFFGDNVPKKRVEKVEKLVTECEALLVMGTTLSTLSSLRIVQQAFDLCKFICIVNDGKTKGDKMADLIIETKFSEFIPKLELFN